MGKTKVIELSTEQRAALEKAIEKAKATPFGCAARWFS
jgi:hypothetical protein